MTKTDKFTLLKSNMGYTEVRTDAFLAMKRIVFLEEEITNDSAYSFAKQMMNLVMADEHSPIKLVINSPGGEIEAGMMIIDVIRGLPVPVQMYCMGNASSMAAIIFVSGKDGRYILPNSKLMIHQPLIKSVGGGNCSEIKKIADNLEKRKAQLFKIVEENSDVTIKMLEKETKEDRYYTAEEAVKLRLADKIVTFEQILLPY